MLLKTVEGLSSLQASAPQEMKPKEDPQKAFLHFCFNQHVRMWQHYAKLAEEDRKPMMLVAHGMEFGPSKLLHGVDTSKFVLPTNLLRPQSAASRLSALTTSPILPLLRCLGVPNSLRLVSALMSDRRVLLVSSSPTRLAVCARSALSIIAQGVLSWQHLFIPVLPPHLLQYLQAPMPYMIGVLSSLMPTINQMPDLGELLLINLDQNALETRGIPTHLIGTKIPDLFSVAVRDETLPYSGAVEVSSAQLLAHDLTELLKTDRKQIFGETAMDNVQETAKVAVKAVKSAFGRLRNKGKKLLQGDAPGGAGDDGQPPSPTNLAATETEIYTEGCQNELGEEEVRIAFCSFFLGMYGNLRWYLGNPQPGQVPQLDRERFLQQKRGMGEGEGSPIFPLLQNMCQSQMFEEFVKARVSEIQNRVPVTKDSPLFLVCANYHRKHNIDFSTTNVRRVTRQVAQVNPSLIMSQANANARRNAMALTSNRAFEGVQGNSIASLVEACHEMSILNDVASVLWMRLRDCRGGNWKHAVLSLQLLRNLLFHGPIAAIPEATDGLDRIRALKLYNENMRSANCQQVRQAAAQVYELLVDRTKLFSIRRSCANRRREIRNQQQPRLARDRNIQFGVPFRSLHPYLHPSNNRQVAPLPQQQPTQPPPGPAPAQSPAGGLDWLGQGAAPAYQQQQPAQANVGDLLGAFNSAVTVSQQKPIDPFAAPIPNAVARPTPSNPPSAPMHTQAAPQPLLAAQQAARPTYAQMPPQAGARVVSPTPPPGHPAFASPPRQQVTAYAQPTPPQQPTYAQMPPQQLPGALVTQSPAQPTFAQMPLPHNPAPAGPGQAPQAYPGPPQQYTQFPGATAHQMIPQQQQPGVNLFVAQPQAPIAQPPQQQAPRPAANQFDPLRRDPYAP